MMNAQPFRSRGVSRRIVVFQSGKEVHDRRFAETWVQEVFTKAGRTFPLPEKMPPLTPEWRRQEPKLDRATIYRLFREEGIGPIEAWVRVYWPWPAIGICLLAITGLSVTVSLLERRRRNDVNRL